MNEDERTFALLCSVALDIECALADLPRPDGDPRRALGGLLQEGLVEIDTVDGETGTVYYRTSKAGYAEALKRLGLL